MKYTWQQKHNHEETWQTIDTSENLWSLIKSAQNFKTTVSHSGECGVHFVEQRVIDTTGKTYSIGLNKGSCFHLMELRL